MTEPRPILPMREPPPGGLERLRVRLAEGPPHGLRIAPAVVGVIVVVVALGLLLGRRPDSAALVSGATLDPRLISLGLQTAPSEPAVVPPEHRHEMALLRVPLRSERVVFYRLVTLPSPTTPGSPGDRTGLRPDALAKDTIPPWRSRP